MTAETLERANEICKEVLSIQRQIDILKKQFIIKGITFYTGQNCLYVDDKHFDILRTSLLSILQKELISLGEELDAL